MIVDYYKELGLSENLEEQKMYLKRKYRTNKEMYEYLKKDTQKYEIKKSKLPLSKENKREIERLEAKIEEYKNRMARIKRENAEIEKVLFDKDYIEQNKDIDTQISTTYFAIFLEEKTRILRDRMSNNQLSLNKEDEQRVLKRIDRLKEAINIFLDPEKRKKYNLDLQYQRYLDSLEKNREARREEEKKYVKNILGENFNPNMGSSKKINRGDYSWEVSLYDRPTKLFVGSTDYTGIPKLNQEIYAYRYGVFKYNTIFNKQTGKSVYEDSLCEIIGVTKKAIDGTETTNFIIAPLRYIPEIIIGPKEENTDGRQASTSKINDDLSITKNNQRVKIKNAPHLLTERERSFFR